MKKVAMKMPGAVKAADPAEAWVNQKTADVSEAPASAEVVTLHKPAEPMKRFTIDVTETLHKRIKGQCAMRGEKMADVIRELLEREFPPSAS
jgi:predicted DNA binding CopG/RHH family protein